MKGKDIFSFCGSSLNNISLYLKQSLCSRSCIVPFVVLAISKYFWTWLSKVAYLMLIKLWSSHIFLPIGFIIIDVKQADSWFRLPSLIFAHISKTERQVFLPESYLCPGHVIVLLLCFLCLQRDILRHRFCFVLQNTCSSKLQETNKKNIFFGQKFSHCIWHSTIHGINLAIRPYMAKIFQNDSVWQSCLFFNKKNKSKKMAIRMRSIRLHLAIYYSSRCPQYIYESP